MALTCSGQEVTFAEFALRVRSAAAQLVEHVSADRGSTAFLPLLLDRSIDSVVAFHAALMSGRPFAPLDPRVPEARLVETLERLGNPPVCAVAKPEFAEALPPSVAPLDLAPSVDAVDFEPVAVTHTSPGFVIFTSGSTGRAKAVVRRWSAFERWLAPIHESTIAPASGPWNVGVLQPLNFSGSHRALVLLCRGYTIHLADPAAMSAHDLLTWFAEQRIEESTLSDTQINSLATASHPRHGLGDLRFVRTGAEATQWSTIERLRELGSPDLVVAVGYATSEASRSFNNVIGPTDPLGVGRVPLGVPIDPNRVRLEAVPENPHLQQLVISDPSTFGYLDDPELSAERFVTEADGSIWWRSGDLAEIDEDGVWHHRGRIDDMVKINGLLVEPREAERVLAAIDGIRSAAVIPHATRSGKWRLVAHVSLDDPRLTPATVHAALAERLPRHLIPSLIVRHDVLPAGDRLKLDRPALRAMKLSPWRAGPARTTYDEIELWLLGRLCEMLELGDIAPDDDLWYLGLDSLGAVEVCAWVADAGFGELQPPQLLEHRTVTALAAVLRDNLPRGTDPVVSFNPDGLRRPWFVLPGGGGTSLAFRALSEEMGPDQPITVIEPRGLHQRALPDRTVEAMARRACQTVEQRLPEGEEAVLIGYSAGTTVAFEVARQLLERGRPARLLFLDGSVRGENTHPEGPATASIGSDDAVSASRSFVRRVRSRLTLLRAYVPHLPFVPSNYDDVHYWRFRVITRRALRRYSPKPLDIPLTVVSVSGSDSAERSAPFARLVASHEVSGDHYTMLQPPHVHGLAEILGEILNVR